MVVNCDGLNSKIFSYVAFPVHWEAYDLAILGSWFILLWLYSKKRKKPWSMRWWQSLQVCAGTSVSQVVLGINSARVNLLVFLIVLNDTWTWHSSLWNAFSQCSNLEETMPAVVVTSCELFLQNLLYFLNQYSYSVKIPTEGHPLQWVTN